MPSILFQVGDTLGFNDSYLSLQSNISRTFEVLNVRPDGYLDIRENNGSLWNHQMPSVFKQLSKGKKSSRYQKEREYVT